MPADNSLAKEAETAGSLSAVTRPEGTAVARTEKIEKIESSLLGSARLSVARFDVRDALKKYKAPSNGKNGGLAAYNSETRELS